MIVPFEVADDPRLRKRLAQIERHAPSTMSEYHIGDETFFAQSVAIFEHCLRIEHACFKCVQIVMRSRCWLPARLKSTHQHVVARRHIRRSYECNTMVRRLRQTLGERAELSGEVAMHKQKIHDDHRR